MVRSLGLQPAVDMPTTGLVALTASIAHEVNQPLAGIMLNASICLQMLASDPPNLTGARETARRTIRDANRATDVIARMRSLFSRQQSSFGPVDLNDAAHEVIARSEGALRRNDVSVRPLFARDLPAVTGDRVQLEQVIHNLLMNAVDAMKDVEQRARRLVVTTELERGGGVRLSVQDSGVGIESTDLNRIFEAFYTTKNDGMGIGLFVSHSIIESHRGRLWATRNADAGVTVSFSLPTSV